MAETLYPSGYQTSLVTMMRLKELHLDRMHPVFALRLFPWIEAQGGKIGIGSGYRYVQPEKPGFAPPGKSFHQDQLFASGFLGFCAVDLVARNPGSVHRSPRWDEVIAQGNPASLVWGVHCNVATEAWHMQPVEIDGYDSWAKAGRPDPVVPPPLPPQPTADLRLMLTTGVLS